MFYGMCLTCGRGYEYNGHLDSWCPACWTRISLYCPKCLKYFESKPSKSCPSCGVVLVQPPPAPAKPAAPKPAAPSSPAAAPKPAAPNPTATSPAGAPPGPKQPEGPAAEPSRPTPTNT